jgi:hypothetical protein
MTNRLSIKMLDDISEIEFDDSHDQADGFLDEVVNRHKNELKLPPTNLMVLQTKINLKL